MHFPSQELMAKDNMTIHVEAVASYKVNDLLKALCDIEDGDGAISQAAQISVRDQLSRAAFDQVLHDGDEAGRNVFARTFRLHADKLTGA
ncbi:MAG: hypothetical protein ASARMPREDX12_009276 [Alectoria sarmentosa]|nr:MAG: hypothetical protein ASARMPREDX12_009276 [Alectoria sarmentosa]